MVCYLKYFDIKTVLFLENATSSVVPSIISTESHAEVILAVTMTLLIITGGVAGIVIFLIFLKVKIYGAKRKASQNENIEDLFGPKTTENPIYMSPDALDVEWSDEDDD